jgi:nicotinate phosphoribosyltransferase
MHLETSPLSVDLYELTMLEAYFEHGTTESASFELFVRRLPKARGFLVAAGLEQALDFLEGLRFSQEEISWLASTGRFRSSFMDRLRDLRFSGDVDAMPEGTVFFAEEPILRVTAPLPEAQLVETRLLNLVHYETLIASKAARVVLAAGGKSVIDFGLRRAHGAEAGLLAARAAFIAGFDGTSNVLAEARFGVPAFGTMAHSFVEVHADESEAFEHFVNAHPGDAGLLLDTYDTEAAARKVVALAGRLEAAGRGVRAVRLDSGDLAEHARRVRRILDEGGLASTRILASSGLDELAILKLVAGGAPIDAFATGTRVVTSADAPYLDAAYKLVEYAGVPRFKKSEGKATWPGKKQVFRSYDTEGRITRDVLAPAEEPTSGVPLLRRVMERGRRIEPGPTLAEVRRYAAEQASTLPERLLRLETGSPVAVDVTHTLRAMAGR